LKNNTILTILSSLDPKREDWSLRQALLKRIKYKRKDLVWLVKFIKRKIIPRIKMVNLFTFLAKKAWIDEADKPKMNKLKRDAKKKRTMLLKTMIPDFQ
jgi:hypothetical protein